MRRRPCASAASLDVASWFSDAVTGAVLAPTAANGSRFEGNITASFETFEDHDRHGQDY